jgi:hypothetical protein
MAVLEDLFEGWGTTALVGLGVMVAAPVLLPTVGAVLRPVLKTVIKSSFWVMDSVQGIVAEGSEELSKLTTEARAEHRGRAAKTE